MKILISLTAAFLSGLIGSMGMGGGAVLIIYLTVFMNEKQFRAQGINLLFFIPIAAVSVFIYARKKQIEPKTVIPLSAGGVIGVGAGVTLASFVGVKLVAKGFGTGIALLGIYEIIKGIKSVLERKKKKCYNKNE